MRNFLKVLLLGTVLIPEYGHSLDLSAAAVPGQAAVFESGGTTAGGSSAPIVNMMATAHGWEAGSSAVAGGSGAGASGTGGAATVGSFQGGNPTPEQLLAQASGDFEGMAGGSGGAGVSGSTS